MAQHAADWVRVVAEYLSLSEAARHAGLSRASMQRALARGELPSRRDGMIWIARTDLDAWIAAQRVVPRRAEGGDSRPRP